MKCGKSMKKAVSVILILVLAAMFLPSASVFAEHSFTILKKVDATCEEEGFIEYVCNGCETIEQPVRIMGKAYLTVEELLAYSASKMDQTNRFRHRTQRRLQTCCV